MINPQRIVIASLVTLGCTVAVAGCGQTSQASNTPSNAVTTKSSASQGTNTVGNQTGNQPANETGSQAGNGTPSTPPPVVASDIPFTVLSSKTVTSDTSQLQTLLQQHPGDGITRGPAATVYNIGMTIHPDAHTFQAIESVHFTNNLGKPLSHIYFNVWADSTHYMGQGSNQVITNVTVDGTKATADRNGTVLSITPSQPLEPGSVVTVKMSVSAILPHNNDRYGWEDTGINLGNWYPILAVYDQNGWVTPPYYSQGESFYSLTGAYHLTIKAPKNLVLAVTGEQSAKHDNGDGTVTQTYSAVGVRDAAMVANTAYQVIEKKVGGVTVSTYYTSAQAADAQWMENSAIHSVETYDKWYGTYPYQTLRICAMRGWFGGMEYPELDMISFQPSGNRKATTQLIVDHEVAHQWFYGLVGDDEYLTPMLDESFAEFSQSMLDNEQQTIIHAPKVSADAEPSDPVSAFSDSNAYPYFNAVYLGGANMLYDLYTKLGETKFHAMLQAYVNKYEYRVATIQDFVNFVSQYTGTDMTSWFAVHGVKASDGQTASVQPWAKAGMKVNGVNWHHNS